MKLTWNLNMPRLQKLGVRVLFGTGFVCIIFAIIRVVQIGSKTNGGSTQPDPAWLMLWTILESSIAVVIACCPALAALYRTAISTQPRRSYDARGYLKQESNSVDNLRPDIKLKSLVKVERASPSDTCWPDGRSSQEEFAGSQKDIRVTTTVQRNESALGIAY
jgi:hypothetical protein